MLLLASHGSVVRCHKRDLIRLTASLVICLWIGGSSSDVGEAKYSKELIHKSSVICLVDMNHLHEKIDVQL